MSFKGSKNTNTNAIGNWSNAFSVKLVKFLVLPGWNESNFLVSVSLLTRLLIHVFEGELYGLVPLADQMSDCNFMDFFFFFSKE